MEENSQLLSNNPEPGSCSETDTIANDTDKSTENVKGDNPCGSLDAENSVGISNGIQPNECTENANTDEQVSLQIAPTITNTNLVENRENVEEIVKPSEELPLVEQCEVMLLTNEVLSSSFDSSVSDDCATSMTNTREPSQSSLDEKSNKDDIEDCVTRACTVSLPNIDNILSQSDKNGRTDVAKIGNTLKPNRDADGEEIENDSPPEKHNDVDNIQHDIHADQNVTSASSTNEIVYTNHPVWNSLQNTEYVDSSYSNSDPNAMGGKCTLKRSNSSSEINISPLKKSKKGITFDSVSVYYFPRTQGFTCIPSQGGSTLGMSWNHSHIRKFSLGEHAAEQRRAHRQFCSQQFSNSRNWNEMSTISSEDSDSDEVISDSEMDYENYNFLQPIPTRERRAMLRASGIHKIDSTEKDECRSIRLSREFCGCTCQVYCDPERCVCAQAGIKCQVDRMNFPCSCTREGCANANGRVEFNPVRVRTHYIHTLMRLDMEKKKEEEEARNKLILNNMESNPQLSYSTSSLDLSGNMMNFSYHNELQSYYSQPPVSYGTSTASSIVNSCFNFTYAGNDQFVIPSTAASIAYHESMTNANMRLAGSSSQMDYCCTLNAPTNDCLRQEYNGLPKEQDNQNFVIRDLSNGSESSDGNVPYAGDSFMQLTNENFAQHVENANQHENLDTSVEASEETEKEESDSENFGNIIKKTMVESVIA